MASSYSTTNLPKFKYGTTSQIQNAPIVNGAVLLDITASKLYIDIGNRRYDLSNYYSKTEVDNAVATKAPANQGIEFIEDTRTSAVAAFTGVSTASALTDGMTILFRLKQAGKTNATLNLTLADGSTTGAKPIFNSGTTRLSTQYVATNIVMFTYSSSDDAWYVVSRYVDNNSYDARTNFGSVAKSGSVAVLANTIVGYAPSNGGYTTLTPGLVIDLGYPVLYCTTAYAANTACANTYVTYTSASIRSFTSGLGSGVSNVATYAGLTLGKPLYLVGTYSNGRLTVDSTLMFVTDPPAYYDGKVYLLMGGCRSTYNYNFITTHTLFKYYDGAFQEWTPSEPEMPEYIVANATTTGVNGTYVFDPSEYGYENSPVFTNGTYYLYRAYAIEQQRVIWVFNTSVVDHGTGQDRTWDYGEIVANSTSATVPTESGYSESELTVTVNRDYYIKSEVDSKVSTLNSSITTLSTRVNDKQDKLPTSGSTGQYLQKTANGVQWADVTDGSAAIDMANCRVLALSDASTIQSIGLCSSELTNKTAGNYLVIWTGEYTLDSDSNNPTDQVLVPGMLYLLFAGATVWSLSRIGIWANDGSTFKQGNLNEWFMLKADFASIMAGTSTLAGLSTKRGLTLAVSATENKYVYVDYASKFASLEARVAALESGSSTPTTGSLTVNGVGFPSGAQWTVDGGTTWYNIGDTATLSPGNYTLVYKEVSGYVTPANQSTTVSAGSTTTITANSYVQYGTLLVNYTGTAPSGAQWTHDGGTTWTNFGSSVNIVPGTYTVSYKAVNGYTSPSSASATVTAGNTTTITADTYTENASTFYLSVSYATMQTPPTGAAWSYDNGTTWLEFGTSVNLTPGTYTITYKPVANYTAPASHSFTAQANDSVIFTEKVYTAATYPNAFVVSGLPNNVDQTTAQFNGTYTKTGNAKTYNGVNYPIYYNGVNYLYMSSATAAVLSPNDGSSPMIAGTYRIGNVSGMSGAGLTGTWTYYLPSSMPDGTYTLTVTESTSTTPEPGTFIDPEDEPTTPTDQYLEISGCATAAMNGKYYFISGDATTAPTTGGTSPRLRHENGHYYIMYYKGGSSSYWCVQNTNAFSSGEPSGSPKYTISSGAGVVSTLFADGLTYGSITTTYVDTNAPAVSNTPWISFAGKNATQVTYNGNYVLYSGDANSTNSVWKHQTKEYYIRLMSGGSSYWGLTNSPSGTTTLVWLSDYNPSTPPAEFTGTSTYMGCHIVYHDGTTQPPTGAHLTVWNEYTYTYNDDYYLTSGTASSNNAVWTSVSGNYVVKFYHAASDYLYVWDSTGTNKLEQISSSDPGVATSWGSTVQTYNGYNTKYNAS